MLKKNKELILLNGCLTVLILVIFQFKPFSLGTEFLFFGNDSKEYLQTASEYFDLYRKGYSYTRPPLYPMLLGSLNSLGGKNLIFIGQLLLWMASANLLYFTFKKKKAHRIWSIAAVLLYCANLSLLELTLHALTEVLTAFLFCLLLYTLVDQKINKEQPKPWLFGLLFLVVLTLVKPVFFLAFIAVLIAGLLFYRKVLKTVYLKLLLIVFPLLLHLLVMFTKYGEFKVSYISSLTFERYILTQTIERVQSIDRDAALEIASKMKDEEKRSFVKKHFSHFYKVYTENLNQNISAGSTMFQISKSKEGELFYRYTVLYSGFIYRLFNLILLGFVLSICFGLFVKGKMLNGAFLLAGIIYFFVCYASGISNYQGDRLVVFVYPLFIFLFLYLGEQLLVYLNKFRTKQQLTD